MDIPVNNSSEVDILVGNRSMVDTPVSNSSGVDILID